MLLGRTTLPTNQTCSHSIGKSVQGRDLWVLELSSSDPKKYLLSQPEVRLVAGIHGNERVGPELLLQLAHALCKNYGSDYTISRVSVINVGFLFVFIVFFYTSLSIYLFIYLFTYLILVDLFMYWYISV